MAGAGGGIMADRVERFDHIIVGAGSAGCVLAARLSADVSRRVLLLEAGRRDNHPLIPIPLGHAALVRNRRVSWDFTNEPEPMMPGHTLHIPRGKTLGGSSSINSMICVRGHGMDYDEWRALGCEGWSHAEVLPYFKRAERFEGGGDTWRGVDGPIEVRRGMAEHPLYDAFMAAGAAAGWPATADYNGARQEGFCTTQHTIRHGHPRRCSTAVGYLRPALRRPNLVVRTGARVGDLALSGNRVAGVRYRRGGRWREAQAGDGVILSAGAYQTPQILMLSGIGPGAHLRALGIDVHHHMAGVGADLQDHFGGYVQHACTQPITLYRDQHPWGIAKALARYFLFGTGPMTHFPVDRQAFLASTPGLDRPDLQFLMSAFLRSQNLRIGMSEGHGYCISWCQLRPESRGRVSLASADPFAAPRILHNYVTHEADRAVHRRALEIARALHAQAAFDPYRGDELLPGAACASGAEIDAFIPRFGHSHYHPVGTARMAQDEGAVVDPSLRVHGIEGLRVVDASIMPRLVGANINMPTIMIAEKAADMILGRAPPAPIDPADAG